jgi:hypothetical protein
MRKIIMTTLSVAAVAVTTLTPANAATAPKANGACATVGMSAKISGKTYQCAKNLGGKSVWMIPSPTTAANKPSVGGNGGGNGFGNGGHPSDEGSAADIARHAAMKKFSDCLAQHGVTQLPFGPGRGRDDQNGVRPTLSAKDQAAINACAAYRPKFGRPGDDRNGGAPKIPAATPTAKV